MAHQHLLSSKRTQSRSISQTNPVTPPTKPSDIRKPSFTMGLIKTAMISGAAIYGINKLAKTAEHRREHPMPSQSEYRDARSQSFAAPEQRGSHYPEQQSYGQGQEKGQAQGLQFEDRGIHQQQSQQQSQPLSLENNPTSALPWGYSDREYAYAAENRRASPTGYNEAPPHYQNSYIPARSQRQSGFVQSEELSDSDLYNQGKSSGGAALLSTLAQQFMGSDGGNHKGKDVMKMFSK
ncbi:hypothetical protein EDD36DRAFT_107918 [Exophiala viscosa]|uniref:Uncharacterized protein n=1 Tax=Exophiala viscosa TaxID=2486360 RepID=A0AAN6DN16_9EURO|nr:hypothetical protein EDD36DRAFT_107918 [Exophiala viscosa]